MRERKLLVYCVQNCRKKTLKAKHEALKERDKNRPNKEVTIQFNDPKSTLATWYQPIPLSVEEIVSEFSEQHAEIITDGDDENEDEESDEQIAYP